MRMSHLLELLERRADSDIPDGAAQPTSRAMARIADAITRSEGNSAKVMRAIEIRADKTTDPTKRKGLAAALRIISERGTTDGMKFSLPNGDQEQMPTWKLSDADRRMLNKMINSL
jgi:hypothetical protein